MPHFEELGFYTLAGAPASTRDLVTEVSAAEALGLGHVLHLRAVQREGSGDRSRARSARSASASPSPPRRPTTTRATPRHRRVRHDHAQPHRRPLHARARPRHRPRCSTRWASRTSRRPRWRTSPASCGGCGAGEVVLGHDGPAGSWPFLHLDAHSTRTSRSGSSPSVPTARARRARVRPGRAAHVLHRRDHAALRARR